MIEINNSKPKNLIEIFKAGHEIIAAVTQPDRKRGRGKKLTPSPVKNVAIDLGIPVLTTPSISKDSTVVQGLFTPCQDSNALPWRLRCESTRKQTQL